MDYGYADSAAVEWSDWQQRFELILFEGEHILHKWVLSPAFTAPSGEIKPRWLGIEEINQLLAEAKVYPSGVDGWVADGPNRWKRGLSKRRERNQNDH